MIAYVFPPEGSAGTYRPLRFVRHLPSHGWRPVVIAEKTQYYERYDPQLLDLLPSGVEIVRVPNPDPWKAIQERRTQKFRQKISSAPTDVIVRIATSHERPLRTTLRNLVHTIESIVYFPDLTMRWIRPATEAARPPRRVAVKSSGRLVAPGLLRLWPQSVASYRTSLHS